MKANNNFTALRISIASPDDIKSWSHGEVTKPETINYRSLKTEKNGLFDEKIFGPTKDFECFCGKYKGIRYRGIVCDRCNVEITLSRVRRERMGHITLAAPVAHIWFFKGALSKLSLLLDISPRDLSSIMYFSQYMVLEADLDQRPEILESLQESLTVSKTELESSTLQSLEEVKNKLKEDLDNLKAKGAAKETFELRKQELELKAKQQMAKLKDRLKTEVEQTEEIYSTITEMVRRISKGAILSEDEFLKLDEYDAARHLRVGMGAEAVLELVHALNIEELVEQLRTDLVEAKGAKRIKSTKRLRVIEGFRKAGIDSSWMFLTVLPVLPPDLRPMVQLSGGRFATSDLNDLYRRVINRNNRLKHLIDLGAPEIILRNEKRMLQEAVDSLIDSSQARQSRRRLNRRPLRSLSEMLRGKQGRFRQNLLGKRVDYSGRSVIVVGPELHLDQVGIPKDMALELFKPFVLRELVLRGIAPNVKSAKFSLERKDPEVYDVLEEVTRAHPVVINRAPTLHKLGMQAFFPVLIEGQAIRLHPCVCSGYNADFDGDQVAVHVPLTPKAQEECRTLMLSSNNLLKPANGEPVTVPNKEMAMGLYYHTVLDKTLSAPNTVFANADEAYHAYMVGAIKLNQPIRVRVTLLEGSKIITSTVGRLQFNDLLPMSLRYVNEPIDAKRIKALITKAIAIESNQRVATLIDAIKALGFAGATRSGLSVAVSDCAMIDDKDEIIAEANKRAESVQNDYLDGLISNDERRRLTFDIWMKTTDTVADKTWDSYADTNAVKMIINSGGSRASKDQVKQLAAMRGLVVDPLGNIVEMPTKSNFRQGLTIFEYVTSARGSRKGLTDSALKTADAGYLTRRLVDVAHDVIIRMDDCGTSKSITVSRATRSSVFGDRLLGKTAAEDIVSGKKILVKLGEIINDEIAAAVMADESIQAARVFSPLTCEAPRGLCAKCYGWDFSTRQLVQMGVPVGVISAQSIGEPGTQLTMRVKHSGGIIGLDVTQDLPRVEEVLEARNPKNQAVIAELAGKVSIKEEDGSRVLTITTVSQPTEEKVYTFDEHALLVVEQGQLVSLGQPLTAGSVNPSELLEIAGLLPTQQHLIDQVQAVYESQGIPISDKHFEVTVRKMGDKIRIDNSGDTDFLTGEVIERARFTEKNDAVIAQGGEPASGKVMILGITRSSLFTSSWLSAASFQHTKHVLTDAASVGALDLLEGLKENVIIGRLIPTDPERARLK